MPTNITGSIFHCSKGLIEAAERAKKEKNIRAVVIDGEGPAFCAGLDFAAVAKKPAFIPKIFLKIPGKIYNPVQKVAFVWREISVPVIAVIHGFCFGGGMQIVMGADFRFSTPDADFSILESKWGLIPDMSGMVTFRECVKMDTLKMLTMTGRRFRGEEAKNHGFVTDVADDPMQAALSLIEEISERSPDAVAATKDIFQRTRFENQEKVLSIERKVQARLLGRKNQRISVKNGLSKDANEPFATQKYKIKS